MTGSPRHRMTGTALHNRWKGMLSRCYNPNTKNYKNYGGRGIKVCLRWLTFENFRDDMAPTFDPALTLERDDNDGDYEPTNCRWVARSRQSGNRRAAQVWQFSTKGIATNTSGIRGVSRDKATGKWIAHISVGGKQRNLGRFSTKAAAAAAYREAARQRAICASR